MFNATFNNISAISWRSVLLVEETGVLGENQRPAASHAQTSSLHTCKLKQFLDETVEHMLFLMVFISCKLDKKQTFENELKKTCFT